MQSVTSRIWTRVAVSISYDDNHYTNIYIQDVSKSMQTIYMIMIYYKEKPKTSPLEHVM